MSDKKNNRSPLLVTPLMTASHAYCDKPDDKAPEGAKFKPDGKFKVTGIFDDLAEVEHIEKAIREMAGKEWDGEIDWDDFQWPWKTYDADDAKEHLRGKVTITPKTKNKPQVVDAKRQPVAGAKMANGDVVRVFGGDRVKCAVTIYLYEKVEKVKDGKKMVDVKVRGASLQLGAVQVIEKRAGGGGYASAFGEEDGFVQDDAEDAFAGSDAAGGETSAGDADGDGTDF